jgi:hypothetical protein
LKKNPPEIMVFPIMNDSEQTEMSHEEAELIAAGIIAANGNPLPFPLSEL